MSLDNGVDHETTESQEVLDDVGYDRKRQERKERAVKEREEKIKAERGRVEVDIGRSRQGLDKEEGEREFRCALLWIKTLRVCFRRSLCILSFLGLC